MDNSILLRELLQLVQLAADYQPKGVTFIAISSNDVTQYPADGPDKMKEAAESLGYPFPYLYDESQAVAKAYQAACTPDFYIFDGDLRLAYRGQLDDSRPSNDIPVTGQDIRSALDALLAGQSPDFSRSKFTGRGGSHAADSRVWEPAPLQKLDLLNLDQKPSIGCNIKWKE